MLTVDGLRNYTCALGKPHETNRALSPSARIESRPDNVILQRIRFAASFLVLECLKQRNRLETIFQSFKDAMLRI